VSKIDATLPDNIFEIDNNIKENRSKIDACIFRLYGLDKEEINQVMNLIELDSSTQGMILEHYDAL
jgi:hypothetical protein